MGPCVNAASRSPRTPSLPAEPRGRPVPPISRACPRCTRPTARACSTAMPPPAPGGRCRPSKPFSIAPGPPSLRPMRRPTPQSPSVASRPPPPVKRVPPPAGIPPAPCFSSRSNAAVVASASSRRTAPEGAATPSEPPSTGTPLRRPSPPPPDLLGEPRLHSICPVQPPLSRGAGAEHLAAPRPPASPLPTCHRAAPSTRGDRAQCGTHAAGHPPGRAGPVSLVHNRPPCRVSGPVSPKRRRSWADLRPITMRCF
jgi:DNA polymerase beta